MKVKTAFWGELGWKEWTVVAAGLAISVFVAAKVSPTFREILLSNNTASWVQGLGVFLAIVVSVVSQKEADRRKRLDRIETIRIVVADCATTMRMVRLQCEDGGGEGMARNISSGGSEEIRLTAEMLESLDVYDFPNTMALRLFLMLRNRVGLLAVLLIESTAVQWQTAEGAGVRRRLAIEAKDAETCAIALLDCLVFGGKPIVDADRLS